jgi:hypothetical protein
VSSWWREARTPFEVVAEALEDPAGRATFVRGLMFGALAGAAVVGTLLRARAARRRRAIGPGAVDPTELRDGEVARGAAPVAVPAPAGVATPDGVPDGLAGEAGEGEVPVD